MDRTVTKYTICIGFAAMLVLAANAPTGAAPVLTNTAALKSAANNAVTDVRWIARRGWGRRAAIATGVGLAVAGVAASYAYGNPYSYGYQSYSYGYPSSYGYAPYGTGYYGYAPSSYNYGYSGYSSGYYGYGVRRVARGVARRAYYRR